MMYWKINETVGKEPWVQYETCFIFSVFQGLLFSGSILQGLQAGPSKSSLGKRREMENKNTIHFICIDLYQNLKPTTSEGFPSLNTIFMITVVGQLRYGPLSL